MWPLNSAVKAGSLRFRMTTARTFENSWPMAPEVVRYGTVQRAEKLVSAGGVALVHARG
jgi:hypothetical protein